MKKWCSKCHRLLVLTAFHHHRGRLHDRAAWCKRCCQHKAPRRRAAGPPRRPAHVCASGGLPHA
jgi:hypothetical protein